MKLAARAILVVAGLALLARGFGIPWRWEPARLTIEQRLDRDPRVQELRRRIAAAGLPTLTEAELDAALLPPDPRMDAIWAAADFDRTPWSRS